LPDFAVSAAGFVAAGFGAVLAGLFGNALRALASGADGFDFAATFFVFDAALAMAYRSSARGVEIARLTPRFAGSMQGAEPFRPYM
jgi:hypothetical protein